MDRRNGWIVFAGATYAVAALLLVGWGITALDDDGYLPESGTLASAVSFWGWIAIAWGCLCGLAALLLWLRSASARFVGVTLATMGTVFWFIGLPKLPLAAVCSIIVNLLIVYGLTEHCPGHD